MATGVFTHAITTGYKNDEGTITSVVKSYTGDAEVGIENTIAVGGTNVAHLVAVTKTQILAMVLYASTSMTIKTNSSSTPQDTINIGAGQQVVWTSDSGNACPFSGNVTEFFVTNNDAKAGNFKFRALLQA